MVNIFDHDALFEQIGLSSTTYTPKPQPSAVLHNPAFFLPPAFAPN